MHQKVIMFLILNFGISLGSFSQKSKSNTITYDFSCMDSETTNWLSDLEKELISTIGVEASFSEEIDAGVQVLDECKKEYTFITKGTEFNALQTILNKLKVKIPQARGFTYQLYYIDDPMINAFTVGGKIFFTSGMYKFCKNQHEIASILAHEIAHNELGHIKDGISKTKTYEYYIGKKYGGFTVFVANILTISFNQKNEAHCDMWGIDVAKKAGYQTCHTVSLWKRMNEKKGTADNDITSLMSSHPNSGRRADCVRNHLKTNYNIICSE